MAKIDVLSQPSDCLGVVASRSVLQLEFSSDRRLGE